MIHGAHFLLYSKDPEADREFFRDVLKFRSVDVGHGWLIFALPPSELAVHPGEFAQKHADHEVQGCVLYLMCDDLAATMQSLEAIQAMEASKLQMMLNRQALANYLIGGNQQELTTFNAGLSELENRFKTADARAFTDEQHTAVAKMRAQERFVILSGHETNFLAIGFVCHLQAKSPCNRTNFGFRHPTEGRKRTLQLFLP